jgi:cell wall-associated NlpC family hydrolase
MSRVGVAAARQTVVAEAASWLGTPYHHMGRVKGAHGSPAGAGGVDCLTLLAEVYERAGVIGHAEIPFYPPDWHLHRSDELYLGGVLDRAKEIPGPPQPGDIAIFKMGRCFAHGVIVTRWPRLIHAHFNAGVIGGDATQGPLAGRTVRFFDPFVGF